MLTYNGILPSNVSATVLPGTKWLPNTVSVPPIATLSLPFNERAGERTVRPSPMMLRIIRTGIKIAAIMAAGAQPVPGCGVWPGAPGGAGCDGCGGKGIGVPGGSHGEDGGAEGGITFVAPRDAPPGRFGAPGREGTPPNCGVPCTIGALPAPGMEPGIANPKPSSAARLFLSSSSSSSD